MLSTFSKLYNQGLNWVLHGNLIWPHCRVIPYNRVCCDDGTSTHILTKTVTGANTQRFLNICYALGLKRGWGASFDVGMILSWAPSWHWYSYQGIFGTMTTEMKSQYHLQFNPWLSGQEKHRNPSGQCSVIWWNTSIVLTIFLWSSCALCYLHMTLVRAIM